MVTKLDIIEVINRNNINNKVITLYSSYKSFGEVVGGPNTIIDAFLDCGCTLVVPTFTYQYAAYPPSNGTLYKNNGIDLNIYSDEDKIFRGGFSQKSAVIHRYMGIIPKLILERAESIRGNHPLNSFTAIGSKAELIVKDQDYNNVYVPFKRMKELKDSLLLLVGVDFTSTTPIHFSEELSGRNLFKSWAYLDDSSIVECSIGSCSDGFNNLKPTVKEIETLVECGNSKWSVYNFEKFIDITTQAIIDDGAITKCDKVDCVRCRDAMLGGPVK